MNGGLDHICAHIGYIEDGEMNETLLQTQDLKFESWWFKVEHATSRSHRLPTTLNIY